MAADRTGREPASAARELVTGMADPRRLKAVSEAELHGHLDDENLQAIVETLRFACRVPMSAVSIVSPNLQTCAAAVGVAAASTFVPDDVSFCAEVVDTGRELVVPDARAHPVYRRNPLVRSGTIAAYAAMPLCDGGFVLGVVSIFDAHRRAFTDDELAVLRVQSTLASNVLALRRSARTDTLTGLPNRALCLDNLRRTLSRLARNERGVAVMFVDVDNFKTVNDQFGHTFGDELLVRLANGMSSVLRPTDTLARYGGDEFVVVCEDVADMAEAREIAERLASAIADAVPISDLDEPVSVSLGIALATDPNSRAEDLITAADGAMYRAKYSKTHARWGAASHAGASSAASGRLHETAPAGAIGNDLG